MSPRRARRRTVLKLAGLQLVGLELAAPGGLSGCHDDRVVDWAHGALALAATDEHLYWTSGVDHTGLLRVARSGGDPHLLYDGMPWGTDLSPGPEAMFIATGRGVERAPYVGLRGEVVVAERDGAHRLCVHRDEVFWLVRRSGAIRRADLRGGRVTTLSEDTPWGHELTVAGRHVFWTAGEPGRLLRVPIAGGATEVLAEGLTGLGSLAVDDHHVHVAHATGVSRWSLWRGGGITALAEGRRAPTSLRLMSDGLCWCEDHQLVRWTASTGALRTVPAGQILALATEGDTAWWIDGEAKALRRATLLAG